MVDQRFELDGWQVDVAACRISRAGTTRQLEPKVMGTLACLAAHPGEVMTKAALIQAVWQHTFVTDAALTRCVFEIRRAFEDSASNPRVIETITKVGYRLIAQPRPWVARAIDRGQRRRRWPSLAGVALSAIAMLAWYQGVNVDATPRPVASELSEVPAATNAYRRGVSHYVKANYLANANAITFFERAVAYDPSFSLAYTRLADTLTQLKLRWGHDRLDEAQAAASSAIALDPTDPDSYSALGLAQLLREDTAAALDSLQRAYAMDPDHWKSMYNAAIAHHARFEHAQAIALFHRVIELAPEHYEAMSRLGYLYLRVGNAEAARHWLEQTLLYAPESVRAWTQLATLALVTRDTAQALENCGRVLAKLPLHEPCIHVTAIAHQLQGEMGQAQRFFDSSIANHEHTDYSQLGLAQILISDGREDAGREAVRAVLAQVDARQAAGLARRHDARVRAACHAMLGDTDQAIAWLEESADTGRRFPLWDATDPVFASLHGDARFNRLLASARAPVAR